MSSNKKTNLSNEMLGSEEDGNTSRRSKNSKKKKKSKPQSSRSETSSPLENESELSSKAKRKKKMLQIGADIDEEKALEYDDDMNEHGNNRDTSTRKKKDRKKKKLLQQQMMSESEYSGSTISSNRYNERGRNNMQPLSVHSESHYDNGYIDYDHDHDDYMSAMGNNDPIDDYGPDYDLSEEDEEEPRFKYSTADLADDGWRNQKCCLLASGFLFILIAITVSIIMAKLQNRGEERLLFPSQGVRRAHPFLSP